MWASAAAHLPRYLAQAARPPVARRASLRSDSGVAPATFSAIPSPFAVDTVARPGPPCPPLDVAALRFFFFFFCVGAALPRCRLPPAQQRRCCPRTLSCWGLGRTTGATRTNPSGASRFGPPLPPAPAGAAARCAGSAPLPTASGEAGDSGVPPQSVLTSHCWKGLGKLHLVSGGVKYETCNLTVPEEEEGGR